MTIQGESFKKLAPFTGRLSAKEYNRLTALTEKMARSMHSSGLMDSTGFHSRRTIGAVADPISETVARIVRGLSRGDANSSAPRRETYLISLTITPPAAWNSTGYTYVLGATCTYNEQEWITIVAHVSDPAKPPGTWGNWTLASSLFSASVYHYQGNLLEAAPWFQVGDNVTVISTSSGYKILETVTRTEYLYDEDGPNEERIYSIVWSDYNETHFQLNAVFS